MGALREAARPSAGSTCSDGGRCAGSDRDQTAIRAAIANANRAGLGNHLLFERRTSAQLPPRRQRARAWCWSIRPTACASATPSSSSAVRDTSAAAAAPAFPGWEAGVFTGDPPWGARSACAPTARTRSSTAPIECRLLRFQLDDSAKEPDPGVRAARLEAARSAAGFVDVRQPAAQERRQLAAWARREDIACYRVYDADMPEYAFAIDLYGNDAALGLRAGVRGARASSRMRPRAGATKRWP